MRRLRLVVERAGYAVVQDLGRPGHAGLGVSPNGASDQHAARTANLLVGNAESAPLVEATGSELVVRCEAEALVAVTGPVGAVFVDGHPQPAWELLPVPAGARVRVPAPDGGLRTYLAVNGALQEARALGSVAPDRLLGVGRAVGAGDELLVESGYTAPRGGLAVFRLAAPRGPSHRDGVARVDVTAGPEAGLLEGGGLEQLETTFRVLPDSDQVGLRLDGPPMAVRSRGETLSRGVPVGAVQVPHSGGVIVLLRGRLVTAGYPIVAVATSASVDVLGQLRPGDSLRFTLCTAAEAVARLRDLHDRRRALAGRVRTALTARGLGGVVQQPALPDLRGAHT